MIKIKKGYGPDEYEVIPDDEAHVAYYLFAHPTDRAIFSNGITVRGQDIMAIGPAYHETIGWNPSHKLNSDDWNEIRDSGIGSKLRRRLELAKTVAKKMRPEDKGRKLPDVARSMHLIVLTDRPCLPSNNSTN